MSEDDYAQWLKDNPAPDLADFVREHGDWRRMPAEQWATFTPDQQELMQRSGVYSLVTVEEWCEWDRINAEWQARRRQRYGKQQASQGETVAAPPTPFEACATCGQEAHFGYRDESGTLVWFCAEHRLARWWSDARR